MNKLKKETKTFVIPKKVYYKNIGKSKDNIFIKTTSWDGSAYVIVLTPKFPTKKNKEDTIDFLLGELDSHDAYDKYLKYLENL